MITWISRYALAIMCLTALTGCLPGQGASLLRAQEKKAVPLAKVHLAGGKILLDAPTGFCIDKASVTPRFALMARCDVLGAAHAAGGAPLGLIAVSVLPAVRGSDLPTPEQTALASGLTEVSDPLVADEALIFRAKGPAPLEGMADSHWRGTARVGPFILGIALYGPEYGGTSAAEARKIIAELINQTRSGS